MRYYEVLVSSVLYHGKEALTYSWPTQLPAGTLVMIGLKNDKAMGIIVSESARPLFAVRPIDRVIEVGSVPPPLITLHRWIETYYPAPLGLITQLFTPAGIPPLSWKLPPLAVNAAIQPLPQATTEQQDALATITRSQKPVLIHGDTGTGKTRIYLEVANHTIRAGQSVLILTPEISLTPQLVAAFTSHCTAPVMYVHSGLTLSQRREVWFRIARAQQPVILIGPRSALFYPIQHLGLIVIDETHDSAYKQEQAPRYQTTRVAARLAELHGAKLLMGSATPPISDYYLFTRKSLPIVRLREPAISHQHDATLKLVDMRDRSAFVRSRWLSEALLAAIDHAQATSRQSLVFLNRRGSSRLVLCQNCSWEAVCPHCDLPLTYHHDQHVLICHTCGHRDTPPAACQSCGSSDIIFRSIGTKALEAELKKMYPEARVARFDRDTPTDERMEGQYDAVRRGDFDIIIGTQMLSKGLDLPKLSVVGVTLADTSLYFPDYTAEELTYQLISQVTGRVGRGHGKSTIIVQTYSPKSPAIQAAISKNYEQFYDHEMLSRKQYNFPPYCFMLKLRCSRKSAATARRHAEELAKSLRSSGLRIHVDGPNPCFAEKSAGEYRWQLIVKSPRRTELIEVINILPARWIFDLDPLNLL